MKRIHSRRQIIVVAGMVLCSISDGFIFGQMSGMIDALRNENSSMKLNDDDISLIASIINITCFCGFVIMAALTEIFGRRKSITIISIPILTCWLIVYFAQDKVVLIATRVIVGLSYGGILVLTYINIGEYVSPNMRSFCLNFMSGVGSSIGIMGGHVLSLFFHWRNVALMGLIPTAISTFMPLFWVESPSWLATQKRFDECEKAFKALHVYNEDTNKELKTLIETQKLDDANNRKKSVAKIFTALIKKYIEACRNKYYWKIVTLMFAVCMYRVAAGRVLLSTLAITIIQDITGTSKILGYTLMIDGFALLGSGLSCFLVSKLNMRTLLFTSGVISNIFQIMFALSLYWWPKIGQNISWLKITLLALYYITVTAGPYSVLETLLTELHPLEIKTVNSILLGTIFSVVQFLNIQFATRMFTSIGYHGVFFLNSGIIFLCLFYLYLFLPETKGRTLQEIEYYFKNNSLSRELQEPDGEIEELNKIEKFKNNKD